ncbi:hypothetical protein K1719_007143 [Acacia pycnantha]|nr:hypothetical protein K1719_007143 [Acacia pycnantha]
MVAQGVQPHLYTHNIVIDGLCKGDTLNDACEIFKYLLIKGYHLDVCTYNVMISGLCRQGMLDEAMTLLPKMKEDDCLPDSLTYAILLRALLGKSENDKVENLLHEMIDSGLLLQQQNKVLYIYPFACGNKAAYIYPPQISPSGSIIHWAIFYNPDIICDYTSNSLRRRRQALLDSQQTDLSLWLLLTLTSRVLNGMTQIDTGLGFGNWPGVQRIRTFPWLTMENGLLANRKTSEEGHDT